MVKRQALLAAMVLTLVPASLIHAEPYPSKPRAVLEKFLQLDSEAAGLSADSWKELGRFTTWPAFPGWEQFVVIDGYTVGRMVEGHTRAQATVTYRPIGQMGEHFTADTKPETVAYHLNKVGAEWRVDNPQLPPHVSFSVLKERLQAKSATDPAAKAANDALLAEMQRTRDSVK